MVVSTHDVCHFRPPGIWTILFVLIIRAKLLKSLEHMFSALQAAGVTLKPTKLQFGQKGVENLGHAISEKGLSINADRIEAILALPEPECI